MLVSVAEGVLGQRSVLAVFGMAATVLGAVGWLAAVHRGWARLPAVLAGISLALAVAATQGRRPFQLAGPDFSECALFSFSGSAELALNIGMLMPLGLFAAVATGRVVGSAVLCAATSVALEAAQAVFGTGSCVGQDVLSNSVGGAGAAVLGGLIVRRFRFRISAAAFE